MCHRFEALPAINPIAGTAVDFGPDVQATTPECIAADTAVAVALLRVSDPDRAVLTFGFRFGGRSC